MIFDNPASDFDKRVLRGERPDSKETQAEVERRLESLPVRDRGHYRLAFAILGEDCPF
jgi:hypothetical protein